MKKQASLFNPYSFLILAAFVEYFPSFHVGRVPQPSILLGSIHLYISDIVFLFLLVYALIRLTGGQPRSGLKRKNSGSGIQITFGLFFVFSFIKWLIQGTFDTSNIRMMLAYTPAYAFLFFFPMHMTRKGDVRNQMYLLIAFLVYIFVLHLYAFATEGFQIHILGGEFLGMLGILYFLTLGGNDLLRLSPLVSWLVRGLVIATYFMVGHRSGFIALLFGLITYSIFYRKAAVKEAIALALIAVVGAGVAFTVSQKTFKGIETRASSTFDTTQETYVGRYENIFRVLDLSKEHPLIGKPLVTNESIEWKPIEVTEGNITTTVRSLVLTPHNLVLEWLFYYGAIGVVLGVTLIIAALRHVRRFLRDQRANVRCKQIGVIMLCVMVHNLFFALSNVTASSVFSTYFLYFPLVVLVAVSRNEKNYCT